MEEVLNELYDWNNSDHESKTGMDRPSVPPHGAIPVRERPTSHVHSEVP